MHNPVLILHYHHLLREMDYAAWVDVFPWAIFLRTDSMDLEADLILSADLPYRQTSKMLEIACYQ